MQPRMTRINLLASLRASQVQFGCSWYDKPGCQHENLIVATKVATILTGTKKREKEKRLLSIVLRSLHLGCTPFGELVHRNGNIEP